MGAARVGVDDGDAGSCGFPFWGGFVAGRRDGAPRGGQLRRPASEQDGSHAGVVEVGEGEVAPLRVAVEHDRRCAGRFSDQLDPHAVLIGPEPGGGLGRARQPQRRARDRRTAARRGLPVLAARGRPVRGSSGRATSPAANTPGSAVAPRASTGRPSGGSPQPASHAVSATAPIATSTVSASIARPSSRSSASTVPARPARTPAMRAPVITSTRSARCRSANQRPTSSPSTRHRGAGSVSTIVTSTPSRRAVAATSSPMKPAPTIARRDPARRRSRQRDRVGEVA